MEGLARAGYTHGLRVSAQGLDKRFNEKAYEFMKSVLEEAIAQVIVADDPLGINLLNRFTAVYLADCSTVPSLGQPQSRGGSHPRTGQSAPARLGLF